VNSTKTHGRGTALAAVVLLAAAAAGCQSYRCGTVMHPQIRTVAVPPVENKLVEPELGIWFRQRLIEHFMEDGSLKVVPADEADAVVRAQVKESRTSWISAARARNERTRARDRDAYQSTVFRAEVRVLFEVTVPGRVKPLISLRDLWGTASFSPLPDFSVAKAEGLRQATDDAAARTVAAVTEAW
jgi:hypothetical protein